MHLRMIQVKQVAGAFDRFVSRCSRTSSRELTPRRDDGAGVDCRLRLRQHLFPRTRLLSGRHDKSLQLALNLCRVGVALVAQFGAEATLNVSSRLVRAEMED